MAIVGMAAGVAAAAEITVLSAGAIEPGLTAAVETYNMSSPHSVKVTFNTAPQLRKRIEDGERWDVVIAPPAVLEEFARAGRVRPERVDLGRVGMGVTVRAGASVPEIGSVDAVRTAMLDAESLVFNRASTGLYLEQWLRKNELYDRVAQKTIRYDNGAAVLEHVLKGTGRELGFGAITEILLYRERGLVYVGPLPAGMQNTTSYAAATTQGDAAALAFVAYLGGPSARAAFRNAGIE
ncbi:MAG: substrate-binding domain-containing protein [Casimicrobiaceae bacterium]